MPSQSYQERPAWRAYVDQVVNDAPVLSDARRERLAELLSPPQKVSPKQSKKQSPAA